MKADEMAIATADERYFLNLVNAERTSRGLDRLTLETRLNTAADRHSDWMIAANQFSHTGASGSSPTDRMRAAGFDLSNGWRTAENIAFVSINNNGTLRDEIDQLHQNLMNSTGHRANLLSSNYDLAGLGLSLGGYTVSGQTYTVLMITQNFASTGGNVIYDLAPGVTIATMSPPAWSTGSPARSSWLPSFNGEVFTRSAGQTELMGTSRNDDIRLGSAADRVNGRDGNDWISAGAGADTVKGSLGNDFIRGDGGHDSLLGGAGDDRILGGTGDDTINGGPGNDHLRGNDGADRIDGHDGNDRISGGNGNDVLRGAAGVDRISGDAGNDNIAGGSGNDFLDGSSGNDTLHGGSGADSFIFRGKAGRDTVLDFRPDSDRLLIDADLITGDLESFVQDSVRKVNGGVRIDLADGQWVFVKGADLTAADVADDIFLI